MKKLLTLLAILFFCFTSSVHYVDAIDTIAFITGVNQQVSPFSFTAITAAQTHVAIVVSVACTGGGTTSAVSYGALSLTKIGSKVSTTADANTEMSLWIGVNSVPTGANNVTATCSGSATRVAPWSYSGVDQTTGYNSGAVNTCDYSTSAAHTCAVTTQYNNSWLIASFLVGTSPTLDSNSSLHGVTWNNYAQLASGGAQTPTGSHALGYTNSEAGTFVVSELIPFGASKAGAAFNSWQFFAF